MAAQRRSQSNFALQRAVECANDLGKPLLVYEPLRLTYPWASDRLHRFILDGMSDNAKAFRRPGVIYLPYVEMPGHPEGLLDHLAADAAAVVCDDYPAFIVNRLTASAAARVRVRVEAVDGNGILPVRDAGHQFSTAIAFRRYLQRSLIAGFPQRPLVNPLEALAARSAPALPDVLQRWVAPTTGLLSSEQALDALPIDHRVTPI